MNMRAIPTRLFAAASMPLILLGLLACSGEDAVREASREPLPVVPPATEVTAPPPSTSDVSSAGIDAALADQGEATFTAKGCVACHYVGRDQRLVGPDLGDVASRVEWSWFHAMVTNPDSMIKNDPTARDLFATYMTPMSRQGLTEDEVRSVWEYLRRSAAEQDGR